MIDQRETQSVLGIREGHEQGKSFLSDNSATIMVLHLLILCLEEKYQNVERGSHVEEKF